MATLSIVHPQREEAQPPKSSRARTIVSCLIWTMILLSLAISVCSIIAWFAFHPRVPVIQINTLSVSNISLMDRRMRAEAELGFTVKDENWKLDLWFSKFDVLLLYKNHEISKSNFEPFSLQKRIETSKNVKFAVNKGFHAKEKKTATCMSKDMSRKDVSFSVLMEGWVSITYGNWYSHSSSMEISCKDLKMEFLSTGGKWKLNSDQKHSCWVHFL